jgi:CubicO group peptidase (beta-lactamase class C family)
MKRTAVLSFAFLCMMGYMAADAQTEPEKIDSLIGAYCNDDLFSGVVLVSKNGKIIFKKAYGLADRELDVAMTTGMKFRIASISKPFTALIILQLVDEGILKLAGKITDYLPDYAGKKGDSITIEQLLTHTSGILQNLDPEKEAVEERLFHSLREMVGYAEEADLYFEPGTGFHYSNLAYNLLACIAEKVTNTPFDTLLADRIFVPLEMKDTKQYNATIVEKNLSKGYEYKLLGGYENAQFFDPSYAKGPGGLISSADDLSKFDKALNNRLLISSDLYNKMINPTKHGSYGYGWELNKIKVAARKDTITYMSHSGSINGFGSFLARIEREGILVIVLKNSRTDTYICPAYAPVMGREILSILFGEEVQIHKKSIARQMGYMIGQYGINPAVGEYYKIKAADFGHFNFEESELNKLGIELLFKFKMTDEALRVFELNMHEFPKSYNTYDSYAYALMLKGDSVNSIKYYNRGLQALEEYPQMNSGESVLRDAENARKLIRDIELKTGK